MTFTAGQTSSRHVYTITDPAGLTDTAELAVLVVPNRAPVVAPLRGARPPANKPITIDLAGQATDPDGDTLFFACCDGPQGGAATTVTNGAGGADGVVRSRRRVRRPGDVRLHGRRPAGPHAWPAR